MEQNSTHEPSRSLDLQSLCCKLLQRKKLIGRNICIAAVLAAIWIFPQPRTYQAGVTLAPESENSVNAAGAMSSVASSFGVNLGNMTSTDAIYPMLYPDIVSSNRFLIELLGVQVSTLDGSLTTDYYTYLTSHQKISIWDYPKRWLSQAIKAIMPPKPAVAGAGQGANINPFCLTEEQANLLEGLRGSVTCFTDTKTELISISVTAQDPKVCALLADSARTLLQNYIIEYRTKKSRNDMEYYQRLMNEAKLAHDAITAEYTAFCDAHGDPYLQSLITKRDNLENEMQRRYNAYTMVCTQYETAKAKVQENIPAFTIINDATIPTRPAGPKRMLFILGMMILTFMGTAGWILRRDIFQNH